jgi:hypothetical protein
MRRSSTARIVRWMVALGALLMLFAGPALPAAAVPPPAGAIEGYITCDGNPVADVVVSVSGPSPATDIVWAGTTNASGRYYTDLILAPGSYLVRHYYNQGVCQYAEVVKPATVTAGSTTTVSFSGTPCRNDLLRNGGFESFEAWQVGPTPWPARYSTFRSHSGVQSMRSGIQPPEPDRVSESSFYQRVTIPADASTVTLSFWYLPFTEESTGALTNWNDVSWAGYAPEKLLAGEPHAATLAEPNDATPNVTADAPADVTSWAAYDWQEVLVLDQGYRLLEVLQRGLSNAGASGWVYRTYDLTPYRGRTINLYFNTYNNGYGNRRTWMFVDDVTIMACSQPPACGLQPTNQWVNLYGLSSSFNGAPLHANQIVQAYDLAGTLAGCYVVRSSGRYGAMPVYLDDPETPADEGLSPGEEIKLFVDGQPAIPLGPDPAKWTENGALLRVELAVGGVVTRSLPLHAGWNLISFDVMPANNAIESVLAPIAGKYTRVLASTCADGALSYYPSLPPGMNTLKTLDPYHGYWIYMASAGMLNVAGAEVPDGVPLVLCGRWNLISYLPNSPLSVSYALGSIAGAYSVVMAFDQGALSYYPSLPPEMNSLQTMAPGMGYWVRATSDVSLTYPAGLLAAAAQSLPNRRQPASDVQPTFLWADVYSLDSELDGEPLPVGAVIEAFSPRGVKIGRFVVSQPGRFGPMPLYGDDPTTAEDEGARPGDRISFTINGQPVKLMEPFKWAGEKTLSRLDLSAKSAR